MTSPHILDIRQLAFERNNHFLFENINRTVRAGELLQVSGTNGSGKSTFLRMLAGLIPAEKNSVLWGERCIQSQRGQFQQQLHYLGHQNGLRDTLTVTENLQAYAALQGKTVTEYQITIKRMGLESSTHKLTSQLSAGQRRRASLARLLLIEQPLWILDEPATALDSHGQELFADMLQQHLAAGGLAIVAAHYELKGCAQTLQLGAGFNG